MAVQVVAQTEAPVEGGALSGLGGIIGWFAHYWWAILLFIVLIILIGVLWFLWKKLDDERKQRDDVVYLRFRNLIVSCQDNAREAWVRSYWNPLSLLLIPTIIGVFFIPFIKKESSARIRNIDGNFIGWYLGHTFLDNDVYALMYYRRKTWFFFKVPQLLLLPKMITITTFDDSGKKIDKKVAIDPIKIDNYNGDHDLMIKDVIKRGQYYYFPVYVNKDNNPINLSATIMEDLQKYTGYEIIENLVTDFSSSMRSAVQINSDVRKKQLEDEKPKNLEDD